MGWSSTVRTLILYVIVISSRPSVCIAFDPAPMRHSRPARIRDLGRDSEIDLRSGARITPDVQLTPYVLDALSHSGQSPVPLSAAAQNVMINTAPIIPHPDAKASGIVSDFHLNPRCPRMAEGIGQTLARDPIDFIAHHRM